MISLTKPEIYMVVNRFIGVNEGYLGDFSYSSHHDFYPEFCDLDIDPYEYEGTTRERFIQIISEQDENDQAKILAGVLSRFPIESGPDTRNQELQDKIMQIIERLQKSSLVRCDSIKECSNAVREALKDAETLIETNGPMNAIDRTHTAIHGYFRNICVSENIDFNRHDSISALYLKILREHPIISSKHGTGYNEIKKILRSFISVLDAISSIRNNASLAHPNDILLDEQESYLVINSAHTILQYFDSKIRSV